jgi:chromosome segregation ATPase
MAAGTMSAEQVFEALRRAEERKAALDQENRAAAQTLEATQRAITEAERARDALNQELLDKTAVRDSLAADVKRLSDVRSALTTEIPSLVEQIEAVAHGLERKAVDFTLALKAFKGGVSSAPQTKAP